MASDVGARRALTRKALRDDVYDALLEMLLDNEWAPGESLSIDGLARELGVSPTPVREALVHLEHTGLVTRAALKGYRVAPPLSPEQMAELMDARIVVELAAVRAVSGRVETLVPRLREAQAAHEAAARAMAEADVAPESMSSDVLRAYVKADWGFHAAIMDATGNRYLRQMLDALGVYVHRLRQYGGHGVSDAEAAVREHGLILAALSGEGPEEAVTAMRDHLEAVKARAAQPVRDERTVQSQVGG